MFNELLKYRSMKVIITKIVLIVCLFVSMDTNAQNPFITKADVIFQFDISPDAKWACCSWWGADAISKIRIKKLGTQKVIDIDSLNMRTESVFYGISFLSEDQLIFAKGKALFLYDFRKWHHSKLLDLPDSFVSNITVSKDGTAIYFVCNNDICLADVKKGILNKKRIGHDVVRDISVTVDNQLIYSIIIGIGSKSTTQIWIWDGKNQVSNLTEQFLKEIKAPYIVKATSNPNLYIVAGEGGIFSFDKVAQKATKLVDVAKDRVVEIRINDADNTIYYLTYYHKAVIKTMNMDRKQEKSISF